MKDPIALIKKRIARLEVEAEREYFFDSQLEKIDQFCQNNPEISASSLSNSLKLIANWEKLKYFDSIIKNNPDVNLLANSFFFEKYSIDLSYVSSLHENKIPNCHLSFHSLTLLKGISLGLFSEASNIFDKIIFFLSKERYVDSKKCEIIKFVDYLFSDFFKKEHRLTENSEINLIYFELAKSWRTSDFKLLSDLITRALMLHVESKENNDFDNPFEFRFGFYDVYPVEILAIAKLRKVNGLSSLLFNHTLLIPAFFELPDDVSFSVPPSLTLLEKKVKEKLLI